MIDLPVDEHDGGDGGIANGARRLEKSARLELAEDIRRGVHEGPRAGRVTRDGNRGLGAGPRMESPAAHTGAVAAVAVPLREPATGRRT